MKIKKLVLSAMVGVSLLSGAVAPNVMASPVSSNSAVVSDIVANSVQIKADFGYVFGSGFFVKGDRVVTNYHVYLASRVADALVVVDGLGNEYTVSLLSYDAEADIAVLQTNAVGHTYFPLASGNDLDLATPVKAVVSSNAQQFEQFEGTVLKNNLWTSNEHYDGSRSKGYRGVLSFPVKGGNSGSPVINGKNEIVGVVMAQDGTANNRAVIVRPKDLKRALEKAGV